MSVRLTLRMAAPSIAVSLALLVSGGLGAWYVEYLQASAAATLKLDMATIHAAQGLLYSVTEIRAELGGALANGKRTGLDAVPARVEEMERCLVETEKLVDDPEERQLVGKIREGAAQFLETFQRLTRPSTKTASGPALADLNNDLAVHRVLQPARDLLALEESLNKQSSEKNQRAALGMAWVLWLFGLFGAAAGLVAGLGIARSVTRSIVELYVPVQAASGKLEEVVGPVEVTRPGGLENLDVILRKLSDNVGTVVDRLQRSQAETLRAEQMAALGQLAAGLAHELRNPLTAMKMLIQNAIGGGPSPGLTARDLVVLESETARLERSLQTFLDFARPPRPEKRVCDVCRSLEQTLELVQVRAERQGVRMQCAFPQRPLPLEADHEQLRQVFLNLLLNALDMLPGGGTIDVSAVAEENPPEAYDPAAAPRWITIQVRDNGPGIAAELGEQIFAPYVSTKDSGLGLGLAICRQIVGLHAGTITAANVPEGGAVFRVRIPDRAAVANSLAAASA